jgi:hypothetical protein
VKTKIFEPEIVLEDVQPPVRHHDERLDCSCWVRGAAAASPA